jgi:hypothetical protein
MQFGSSGTPALPGTSESTTRAPTTSTCWPQVVTLPDATHFMVTDATGPLCNTVSLFLDTTAAGELVLADKAARIPERLNLKPLPQYSSMEEAVKVAPNPIGAPKGCHGCPKAFQGWGVKCAWCWRFTCRP